jgi:hypothetical protein
VLGLSPLDIRPTMIQLPGQINRDLPTCREAAVIAASGF